MCLTAGVFDVVEGASKVLLNFYFLFILTQLFLDVVVQNLAFQKCYVQPVSLKFRSLSKLLKSASRQRAGRPVVHFTEDHRATEDHSSTVIHSEVVDGPARPVVYLLIWAISDRERLSDTRSIRKLNNRIIQIQNTKQKLRQT